ncbi:hypothetical protein [Virgibacillus sp. DJP39]|uniref:hypothetical protein n=1 Tax=Virgibacillus sp. DJP39 TaxID=3409790 RepID=UPI003BB53C70
MQYIFKGMEVIKRNYGVFTVFTISLFSFFAGFGGSYFTGISIFSALMICIVSFVMFLYLSYLRLFKKRPVEIRLRLWGFMLLFSFTIFLLVINMMERGLPILTALFLITMMMMFLCVVMFGFHLVRRFLKKSTMKNLGTWGGLFVVMLISLIIITSQPNPGLITNTTERDVAKKTEPDVEMKSDHEQEKKKEEYESETVEGSVELDKERGGQEVSTESGIENEIEDNDETKNTTEPEIIYDLNDLMNLTHIFQSALDQTSIWKRIEGKQVTWQGVVVLEGIDQGGWFQNPKLNIFGGIGNYEQETWTDILNDDEKIDYGVLVELDDLKTELLPGSLVTVSGNISRTDGHWVLEDGEIVESSFAFDFEKVINNIEDITNTYYSYIHEDFWDLVKGRKATWQGVIVKDGIDQGGWFRGPEINLYGTIDNYEQETWADILNDDEKLDYGVLVELDELDTELLPGSVVTVSGNINRMDGHWVLENGEIISVNPGNNLVYKEAVIEKEESTQEAEEETQAEKEVTSDIETVLQMTKSFETSYEIIEETDISLLSATRHRVSISVPLGLSKQELEFNLKHVVKNLYEKHEADALTIFAYREDDEIKQNYSAGRIVFATEGDWSKADQEVGLEGYDYVIDIADTYLNPKESIEVGAEIQFVGDVSSKSESWDSEDIIIRTEEITSATVLAIEKYPMGSMEFIRYQVELETNDQMITGWIHDYDVKK